MLYIKFRPYQYDKNTTKPKEDGTKHLSKQRFKNYSISINRWHQLRTPSDERVHDAVVPHHLLHLPAEGDRPEGVGPDPARRQRSSSQNGARHLDAT